MVEHAERPVLPEQPEQARPKPKTLRERLAAKRRQEQQTVPAGEIVVFPNFPILTDFETVWEEQTHETPPEEQETPNERDVPYHGELPPGLKDTGFVPLAASLSPEQYQKIITDPQMRKYYVEIYGTIYMLESDIKNILGLKPLKGRNKRQEAGLQPPDVKKKPGKFELEKDQLTNNATKDYEKQSEKQEKPKLAIGSINETMRNEMDSLSLSDFQRQVFLLALDRKRTKEIAQLTGKAFMTVSIALSEIRAQIEPKLEQVGIKRLARYKNPKLAHYANEGTLLAEKFMNLYYTDDASVKARYKQRERVPDRTLLGQGYLLLKGVVSHAEYNRIKRYHRELLTISGTRLYITPQNLSRARDLEHRGRTHRHPNARDHIRLRHLAENIAEYKRLERAMRRGELPGIADENGIFVKPDELARFQGTDRSTSDNESD